MLRRAAILGAVVATALLLLFLQNKVYVGHQDVQVELREQPAAAPAPDAPKTFAIVLRDVAGSPKAVETQADWELVKAELQRRLAARPGEKAVETVGEPAWAADRTVSVTVPASVDAGLLRSRLGTKPIRFANPPRELFHLNRGIDIRGGVEFICRLRNQEGEVVPASEDVMAILRSRLDERGLTEPTVSRMSNGDVQVVIPGGTKADAARTRKVLETTGRLEFREILWPFKDPGRGQSISGRLGEPGALVVEKSPGRYAPAPGSGIYLNREDIIAAKQPEPGEKPTEFYRLGPVRLTGSDVQDAAGATHQGQLAVSITFTAVGAGKNEEFTKTLYAQDRERGGSGTGSLAILFDGVIKSNAHVESPSSGSCIIHGRFTQDEIDSLRSALKGGSLAVTPEVLSERVVGASLGEHALDRDLLIRVIAIVSIVGFMWIYYRRLGTVANVCLAFTAFFILATLSIFEATMTLPGLAGLIITIGMAVDTNILIFERIREELKEDKGLKPAIEAGYDRAFLTIIDSHLTTLATSFILYWIGSGPVKGFGLTLMIGIVINLFSGVFIGRLLTDWLCKDRSSLTMAAWVPPLRLPYVKGRWFAYIFSIVTATAGLLYFAFGHLASGRSFESRFDIDFTGGSMVQVTFRQPKEVGQVAEAVRSAYASLGEEQRKASLIDPAELRYQAYYADFGADKASRQWIFRVRDEEGSRIEGQRRGIEERSAALFREIERLRAQPGNEAEVKAKIAERAPLEAEVARLGQEIGRRTEEFKKQLLAAFPGQIAAEGDEVLDASWRDLTLSFSIATLDPPSATAIAELNQRLAKLGDIGVAAGDGAALAVTARYKQPPANANAVVADDPLTARFQTLLAGTAGDQAAPVARVAADLEEQVADLAAGVNIAVAKPFPASEHFSGQVADRMKVHALIALVLSLLAILAYVAARFEFRFGIGAVVALVHDILMTLGIIVALGIRIDLTVVAALLTIIGTSINETIIIYDRIRENLRKVSKPLAEIIDLSVAQTMARTVLTAGTTIATLVILLIFGGEALYPFTVTLLIGILAGLYSSIFVSAPLLLSFKGRVVVPEVEKAPEVPDPKQGILAKQD